MSSRAFLLALTKGWALRGRNEVMNSELSCKTPVKFQVKPPEATNSIQNSPVGLKWAWSFLNLLLFLSLAMSVLFLDSLSCSCWTPILILVNAAWWSCLFLLSLQFSLFSPSSLFCPFISFLPISNAKEIYQTPHVPSKKVGVSAPSSFPPPHPSPSAVLFHFSVFFCVCDFWIFCFFRTIAVLLVAIWLLNFYFSRWLRGLCGVGFRLFLWSSFQDCWLLLHYKAYGSQKLTLSLIFVPLYC